MGKYTFLSKWTVLALTVITLALTYFGYTQIFVVHPSQVFAGILLILIGAVSYALAWIVAVIDSLQERRFLWTLGLLVMLPIAIGPLLYSIIGPKNTR